MKSNVRNSLKAVAGPRGQHPKVFEQVARTRRLILAESSARRPSDPHMLRLALNEAESLAWETRYPHLVFPLLAAEKVQQLTAWKERQDSVRQSSPVLSLAE